ncbi:MAG TPA: glycoside hydrolase family 36 protein [Limnochordales bacterium]
MQADAFQRRSVVLTVGDLPIPAAIADGPVEDQPEGLILPRGPVTLLHPFGTTRFFRHGWHSWSPTGWVDLGKIPVPVQPEYRRPMADDPLYATSPRHTGSGLGALRAPDGRVLLLGALDLGARVEADADTLRGFYEPPAATSRPSARSGGWFLGFGEERTVFSAYAGLLARELGKRKPSRAPRVWCSWYSFYRAISQEALLEVLSQVRELPFDVFQVDDGWQRGLGDWEANDRFPSGMEALAERISAAGLQPGLWLCPFIVGPKTRLFQDHPEWLLRDSTGQPVKAGHNWGDFYYCLDTTLPDVQEWLVGLVRRVTGWGYRYLKLDFLYAAAMPGKRYRPVHREEAYREALQIVRDAAGDAYILACGAPIFSSLGLADGLRVGPDVAPFWDNDDRSELLHDRSGPGARNAIYSTLHRLWLRELVHTDPDVVYFRTRYNLLTTTEKEYLKALALITGFKATSDPPAWLDPEERTALETFLTAEPTVTQSGPYRFRIDGQDVDFSAVVESVDG